MKTRSSGSRQGKLLAFPVVSQSRVAAALVSAGFWSILVETVLAAPRNQCDDTERRLHTRDLWKGKMSGTSDRFKGTLFPQNQREQTSNGSPRRAVDHVGI